MEALQDLRLGLGVEIHEHVTADEEVEARDRRVLHEVVPALRLQELRHDVGLQEIPRRLVAEERGDIDEDGIEELHELLGMDLEVFDVAVEAVDAGELHAARDAAYEARSFVTGKVE